MKRAANNLLGKVKHYGKKIEDWPTSVSAILSFLSLLVSLAALIIPFLSGNPDQTPLISLVEKEAKVAASGDVDSAVSLYADNAVVSDKGAPFGAPTQVRDLQVWEGKDQIRKRYELIKRYAKFPVLRHTNITVTFGQNAKTARAISSTEGIMVWDNGPQQSVSTQNGEIWEFAKVGKEWKITSFTYHMYVGK